MTQTPDQTTARETLTHLARSRAETIRGGTEASTWDSLFRHQLEAAMRLARATPDEWESLCLVATETEAEEWELKLIQADEATAERALERRRNR